MTNANEKTIDDGDEQATEDALSRSEVHELLLSQLIEADVVAADELLSGLG